MKFVARMILTTAVAVLLVPGLWADDTAKPASAAKDDTAKPASTAKKDNLVSFHQAHRSLATAKPAGVTSVPTLWLFGQPVGIVGSSASAFDSSTSTSSAGRARSPQSAGRSSSGDDVTPKEELFFGYSYIHAAPRTAGNRISWLNGGNANLAINVNRVFGFVFDIAGYHANSLEFRGISTPPSNVVEAYGNVYSAMAGPRLSARHHTWTPFVHALFGIAQARSLTVSRLACANNRLSNCAVLPRETNFAMALGGGLDANVSRTVALRLIQAEYLMTRFKDPTLPSGEPGLRNNVRLSAGIVFRFGGNPPPAPVSPSAACSVQPTEVFAGEPVTATASGSDFDPKRTVKYSWNGTGVKVAGSDASTQIDTTGLQPGSYAVTASLSDGGKNGLASCSARFTVKELRPPVVSCSADPASVRTGGTSTINSNASSPDGRRLSYSYTASAGDISGNGATATLNTRDAQPGQITVACNVSDDRNPPLMASSTTTVNVQAPPPPPAPAPEIQQLEARLALHSIYFQTARPTAENPEGGLLDSQAEILKTLAEDFKTYLKYKPDAHLILGGHADPRGSAEYNNGLTQRRVERTKNFLVGRQGVPADHFETRSFGKEDQLTADQIRALIAQDPDLSPADRQQMLNNMQVMVLANNRRVDVTLSTTGQQSTRLYPFNAKDFLALISIKGGAKKPPAKRRPRR